MLLAGLEAPFVLIKILKRVYFMYIKEDTFKVNNPDLVFYIKLI